MKIEIKKITLLNFQGIRSMEVNFSETTDIFGDNATGKTTVGNAFTWLLFGKTMDDNKNFQIKTLDEKGEVIEKLNHEVEGFLLVDGTLLNLKRVYREKWVKAKGEELAKFTGNTEDYFINEVPVSQSEYQLKINSLITETQFKLITNPMYFNLVMDWKQRREMLFKMAGSITYTDVLSKNEKYSSIIEDITTKSIEGYKRELKAKIAKIKESLEMIPIRVDEVKRSMPEMPDVEKLNAEIQQLNTEMEVMNGSIEGISKANEGKIKAIRQLNAELNDLRSKMYNCESNASKQVREANTIEENKITERKNIVQKRNNRLSELESSIGDLTTKLQTLNKKLDILEEKGSAIEKEEITIDANILACPTCQRPFPEGDVNDKISSLKSNFNNDKIRRFDEINEEGKRLFSESKTIEATRDKLADERTKLQEEAAVPTQENTYKPVTMEEILLKDKDYKAALESIKAKETEIQGASISDETTDDAMVAETRQGIMKELDKCKASLGTVKTIEEKNARVIQLESEGKTQSHEMAQIEKILFLLEKFNTDYVSLIEDKISGMFAPGMRFRMFKQLINGGMDDDCTLLYFGVPFSDVNNGGKIQAGIECINAISQKFGYIAPIWVDNSESVTTLPATPGQLVRLIVSEQDKKLRIINN